MWGMTNGRGMRVLSFVALLVAGSGARAEWKAIHSAQPSKVDMEVLNADRSGTTVQFRVNGFDAEKVLINGSEFIQVSIPELNSTDTKGYPELPRMGKNLMVPFSTTDVKLEVVSVQTSSYKIGTVAPSKGVIYRNQVPSKVPYTFSNFYNARAAEKFPAQAVELSKDFVFRDIKGVNLVFNPMQYEHSTGTLTVVTEAVVRVVTQTPERTEVTWADKGEIGRDFVDTYTKRFANFAQVNTDRGVTHKIAENDKLLIISNAKYTAAMKPFVDWKTQMGWQVNLVTMDAKTTGTTYQQIKAFVQKEYDTKKTAYLILVGDADDVPPFRGTAGNVVGREADPMYGLVAGNDNYPDMFVSRLTVNTAAELEVVLNKIIAYEKSPDVNGDWYGKATGIASAEGDPTDKWRAELLRDMMLKSGDYTVVDQVYDPSAKTATVTAAVNEGRGFMNYIGHGSKTQWVTSNFSNAHVDALTNVGKAPVIVSVACVNGQFEGGTDSFAERWLKVGSKSEIKGAAAVYASSTNQSWVPPTVGQKEITRILTAHEANTVGSLMIHGGVAVLEDASSSADQTFQSWIIFGDATMQVRTTKPTKINAVLPAKVSGAEKEFGISVGEANIRVAISKGGQLLGAATSDKLGKVVIPVTGLAKGEAVTFTLTGFNKIPMIQTTQVALE